MLDLTDPGYGEATLRVDVALLLVIVAFVEPRSVLEAKAVTAVDVEPRGSLPCVAWKRDTEVFDGAAGVDDPPAMGAAMSRSFSKLTETGGGDLNATFLCGSFVLAVPVVVLMLPVVVLYDGVRTNGSGSGRGEVVRVAISNAAVLSWERTEGSATRAVIVLDVSVVLEDGSGSPMGGRGR